MWTGRWAASSLLTLNPGPALRPREGVQICTLVSVQPAPARSPSEWEHIFANPMATAAAIDQVVHHSVILEFDVPSDRTGVAQQRGQERGQEREVNRQE